MNPKWNYVRIQEALSETAAVDAGVDVTAKEHAAIQTLREFASDTLACARCHENHNLAPRADDLENIKRLADSASEYANATRDTNHGYTRLLVSRKAQVYLIATCLMAIGVLFLIAAFWPKAAFK